MEITPEKVRAIREALPRGVAGRVRGRDAAEAAGVSYQTWKAWERDGVSAPGAVAVLRLLCIDQGLIGAEVYFGGWLDQLVAEREAA